MPRCRVVRPEPTRLQLTDGDFIDVKRRLNAGEYRDSLTAVSLPAGSRGEAGRMDLTMVGFAQVLQYLLGWSLIGLDDRPLPYELAMSENERLATLRSLEPETFNEILNAINAHEAQEQRERIERKNAPAGESASSAISTSAA
jgi:hypothetical protein